MHGHSPGAATPLVRQGTLLFAEFADFLAEHASKSA